MRPSRLRKIVSGGQTGVDRGALDAALDQYFPGGGWCPAERAAEDGPIPALYPLTELVRGGYPERTRKNVDDSDGTAVVYFGELSGGTELTALYCMQRQKPYKLIDADETTAARAASLLAEFVTHHDIEVLNVAGPRLSEAPKAYHYAYACIARLLQSIRSESAAGRSRTGSAPKPR